MRRRRRRRRIKMRARRGSLAEVRRRPRFVFVAEDAPPERAARRVRFPEPGRGPDDVPRLYRGRAARRARRAARIAMRVGERRRERNANARFFFFLSFSSRRTPRIASSPRPAAARASFRRAPARRTGRGVASASNTRSFFHRGVDRVDPREFSSTLVPRSKPSLARSTTTERRGDASASSASSAASAARGGGRRRHPPQRHRRPEAQGGRQRRALRKRHRALFFFVTKGPSVVVRRAVEPDRAFKRGERARGFARARRQTQSSVGADAGLGSAVFRGVRREHAQRVRPRGERARGHAARPQTRHARRVSRRVEAAAAVLAQGLARDVHDDGHVNLATFSPRRSCGLAVSSSRGNAIGGVESRGRAERASSDRLVVILVRAPRAGRTHRRGVGGREAAGAWHARVRVGVVREPRDRKPKTLVDEKIRDLAVRVGRRRRHLPSAGSSSAARSRGTPRVSSPVSKVDTFEMPLARCARAARALGGAAASARPPRRARRVRRIDRPGRALFAGVSASWRRPRVRRAPAWPPRVRRGGGSRAPPRISR